jgi:hypothetical protein
MSGTSQVVDPGAPQTFRRIDAYGRRAAWTGPQYQAGGTIIMLVTSACEEDIESEVAIEGDKSILVIPVDPTQGDASAAAQIVACYRWLLAQLVAPDDVVIIADDKLARSMALAIERLRNSRDVLPSRDPCQRSTSQLRVVV